MSFGPKLPELWRGAANYCALCVSRCGSIAVVENGRFVALEPDPSHPTGQALCAKGRAAPELVYHPDRLLYPLKRTRPKGDPDPGWQRISWDEALDLTAARLRRLAARARPGERRLQLRPRPRPRRSRTRSTGSSA